MLLPLRAYSRACMRSATEWKRGARVGITCSWASCWPPTSSLSTGRHGADTIRPSPSSSVKRSRGCNRSVLLANSNNFRHVAALAMANIDSVATELRLKA
jgi:hypothetical protein